MTHTLSESSGHVHRIHHHAKLVADAMESITATARDTAAAHYAEGVGHAAPDSGTSPGSGSTGGAA